MLVVSYALFEQNVAHPDRARSLVLESGQNAAGDILMQIKNIF